MRPPATVPCPLWSLHLLFVVLLWPCFGRSNLGARRWWEQPGEECGTAHVPGQLRARWSCRGCCRVAVSGLREMQELFYCRYSEQVVRGPAGNRTRKGRKPRLLAPLPTPLLTYGVGGQILMALGHVKAQKDIRGLLRSAGCPSPVDLDPSPCAFQHLWAPECPGISGSAKLTRLPGAGAALAGGARPRGEDLTFLRGQTGVI